MKDGKLYRLEESLMTSNERTEFKPLGGQALRMFAVTIVTFMVLGIFSGIIGNVRGSDGTLNPPHSDYGVDTDVPPNFYYDNLVLNVSVDVTVPGVFYAAVDLMDSGFNLIDFQGGTAFLGLGPQSLPVKFKGYTIRNSGYDGPYLANITLFNDTFVILDTDMHTTSAYNATDFEGPPASFISPHSDQGVDNDGDMKIDFLLVSTNLIVNVSGLYQVNAVLFDFTGMFFIDSEFNATFLGIGPETVDIAFPGFLINASGIDGPYRVELMLRDDMFMQVHNDTYFTNAYSAGNFSGAPAYISPPHSDRGVNIDGDLLYEFLAVSVNISVKTSGFYNLQGVGPFGWTQNSTDLPAGNHTVDLLFHGFQIFNGGVDGPYTINLILADEDWNFLDTDLYVTSFYFFTEFDSSPACRFLPPHWAYGLDTDGDSDYNYLVVNANVTVDFPGQYRFWATLYDQFDIVIISMATNLTFLDTGTQTVEILFDGPVINESGIDGPYHVELEVYDITFTLLDLGDFFTQPYQANDFDGVHAAFNPPHSDYGQDVDVPPDGVYDYLVVNASVIVNDPGWYMITAELRDPFLNLITTIREVSNLSAGPTFIPLEFNGIDINRNGVNGTYSAMMELYYFEQPEMAVFVDSDSHSTNFYNYTDFLSLPISKIWGVVYNATSGAPVQTATITVTNYTHRWAGLAITGSSGYYEIEAFDGDFYALVDGSYLQSNISQVSVLGSTQVTRSLEEAVPDLEDNVVSIPDWDSMSSNLTIEMAADNRSIRFTIDWSVGNGDGFVNQTESDTFMSMFTGESPPVPSNTSDFYYVDGIHFDLVPGSVSFDFNATGSVLSPNPPSAYASADFTSNTTVPVSNFHRIRMHSEYDSYDTALSTSGQLPAGFNLWGHDLIPNVTVSGIGTPNFVIDPLRDPDPLDTITDFWMNLTAGQGPPDTNEPEILNVRINGQLDPVYSVFNIPPVIYLNATIDDTVTGNTPITAANYTIGIQTWFTSTPMNATDGSFDSSIEDVTSVITPTLGTTVYCVYGQDIVPNYNITGDCTSVTILDDMMPRIRNIQIDGGASATYFLSSLPPTATLNATIDDTATGSSTIGGANYTITLPTNWPGVPMNAVDGAFDEASENVTADIPVPSIARVYDLFVHAWDVVPNYNDSAIPVQMIVADDIEPAVTDVALNGQPTVSVLPGTPVFVNATIDDTGGRGDSTIQGANYTIDGDWLTSTLMWAEDGAFDMFIEPVTSSPGFMDTTGWAEANYQVCVYGWDNASNNNTTGACAILNISLVDNMAPLVLNVRLNNQPSLTVAAGTTVFLNATIDDAPAMGSNIQGANYTVDSLPGTDMFPMDGAFDSPTEDVNITIDTTGWADTTYQICVYGWDTVPNNNTTGACALLTITIPDTLPPAIQNVLLNNQATLTVTPGTIVWVNATIDDTLTFSSNIGGANFTVNMTWPGVLMTPVDGSFDSPIEDVTGTIDTTGLADATYQICVFGWDEALNINMTGACVMLTVQTPSPPDTQSPTITNPQATPDPQDPGGNVRVSANITDDVQVFGARVRITDPFGVNIGNYSMTYEVASGEYQYTQSYSDIGTYIFTIWANDTSDNWNSTSGTFEIADQDPPTVDASVSNDNPEVGETVRFEATADDPSGIAEVRIRIEKGGDTILSSRRMTYDSSEDIYWYEHSFNEVGEYTYIVTATDTYDNDADVQNTLTVSEKAAPSFLDYWWLIVLIIVIAVVVLMAVLMMKRKPKVAAMPPSEEEVPPPPPEEPAEKPLEEAPEEPPEEPTEAPPEEETPPPPEEEMAAEELEDVEG